MARTRVVGKWLVRKCGGDLGNALWWPSPFFMPPSRQCALVLQHAGQAQLPCTINGKNCIKLGYESIRIGKMGTIILQGCVEDLFKALLLARMH